VIATSKEELITPKNNGVTGGDSCDNERVFQLIKDYQEVDFYRSPSCKPLPEDFLDTTNGQILKSSVHGTYFVQIVAIEPFIQNPNQNDYNQLLLTLTDGYLNVQALTNNFIPNLNLNTKLGSKLLLTDTITIENQRLQLTIDNTTFKYGSNTYPRPRSAYRNRANGSARTSTEGRRNSQYDNETNFFKRPPPKSTLMDFITTLKISNDNESDKSKERVDNTSSKQQQQQQQRPSNGHNQVHAQDQDGLDEQLDEVEDDPTQANQRERRNPLPPRLQRAQEERIRRNPIRQYDELNPAVSSYPYTNQVPYYPTNVNQLGYLPNQQALVPSTYSTEQMNVCCGYPTYSSTTNNSNNSTERKANGENGGDKLTENNQDGKRRNSNQRPRWKINDMCLARWNEDGEFYYATIANIQPPYCTVLFVDYNTYDQVHFNDLKVIPPEQAFYTFIPPTDLNLFAANTYFSPRPNYYTPTLDGCIMMPEAPPFPFNPAGTSYMYPVENYSNLTNQNNEFILNSSTSPPSKDSNDTSTNDSTEDQHQPTSVADAPLILVTSNEKSAVLNEEDQ